MSDAPIEAGSVTRVALSDYAGLLTLSVFTEKLSYFSYQSLDEEQRRQFLKEPLEAIPVALLDRLPALRVVMVPFLEKGAGGNGTQVSFERPSQQRAISRSNLTIGQDQYVFVATEQQDVADYHYWFFNGVAELTSLRLENEEMGRFTTLIMDELNRTARGEVDEQSYLLKQKLRRHKRLPGRDTKLMREYVRQALEDTVTLYLHGLCCDIDVEPGPRQLSSRYLRRRLELLAEIFPPNPGSLLFPAEKSPAADAVEEN